MNCEYNEVKSEKRDALKKKLFSQFILTLCVFHSNASHNMKIQQQIQQQFRRMHAKLFCKPDKAKYAFFLRKKEKIFTNGFGFTGLMTLPVFTPRSSFFSGSSSAVMHTDIN